MKKKIGRFFRKLGIGKKRHRGGHDEPEVSESNSEVQQQLSQNGPQTTQTGTPLLDLVSRGGGGVEGDNARSEIESDDDFDFDNAREEDTDEVGVDTGGGGTLQGSAPPEPYSVLYNVDGDESSESSGSSTSSGSESVESSGSSESSGTSESSGSVESSGSGGIGGELVEGVYTIKKDVYTPIDKVGGDQDDDLSDSSSESDEERAPPPPPTPQQVQDSAPPDDYTLVYRFLAGGSRSRSDVMGLFNYNDRRYEKAMKQGRRAKTFWEAGSWVYSADNVMRTMAVQFITLNFTHLSKMTEKSVRDSVPDPSDQGHPLRKKDLAQWMFDHGYLGPGPEGGLQVLTPGIGGIARVKSEGVDNVPQEWKDKYKTKRLERGNGEGWSTMGLLDNNLSHDKHVTYNTTKEKREPTVLKLVNGVFTWQGTGEKAKGPDLSKLDPKKDHKDIFAMSPNFVVMREKQLQSEGVDEDGNDMSPNGAAYFKAIQEVLSNPRLIFVMDASGTFYATEAKLGEIHHSTLLGGLDIAAAGELALSGGKVTYVSDASGHYMPGPAFTWQALHEMGAQGVAMGSVDVQMYGVSRIVKGDWFLRNFFPGITLSMESTKAVKEINAALTNGVDNGLPIPDEKGRMRVDGPPTFVPKELQGRHGPQQQGGGDVPRGSVDDDESSSSSSSSDDDRKRKKKSKKKPSKPSQVTYNRGGQIEVITRGGDEESSSSSSSSDDRKRKKKAKKKPSKPSTVTYNRGGEIEVITRGGDEDENVSGGGIVQDEGLSESSSSLELDESSSSSSSSLELDDDSGLSSSREDDDEDLEPTMSGEGDDEDNDTSGGSGYQGVYHRTNGRS